MPSEVKLSEEEKTGGGCHESPPIVEESASPISITYNESTSYEKLMDKIDDPNERVEDTDFPDGDLIKILKGEKKITIKISAQEAEEFDGYISDDNIMPLYIQGLFSREEEEITLPKYSQQEEPVTSQEEVVSKTPEPEEPEEVPELEEIAA